jgi:hypothetical protein
MTIRSISSLIGPKIPTVTQNSKRSGDAMPVASKVLFFCREKNWLLSQLHTACISPLSELHIPSSSLKYPSSIMFQRTFLRQAQAAKSVLSLRATSTTPSVIRRTSQLQPQLQSVRPFVRQPTYRFYSTENQTQNAEKTEAKENEAAEESSEESLRKELEAKQKEIVDLKVLTTMMLDGTFAVAMKARPFAVADLRIGQIHAFRCRLPQPTRTHQARDGECSEFRHPAVRRGPAREH